MIVRLMQFCTIDCSVMYNVANCTITVTIIVVIMIVNPVLVIFLQVHFNLLYGLWLLV